MAIFNVVPNKSYGGIQQVAKNINDSLEREGFISETFFYLDSENLFHSDFKNKNKLMKWIEIFKQSQRFFLDKKIDAIIIHNPAAIFLIPPSLFNRVIYVLHGPIIPKGVFQGYRILQRLILNFFSCLFSKKIICVSSGLSNEIPKFLKYKAKTIFNNPSDVFYLENQEKQNFDYLKDANLIKLVQFGRLSQQKNQQFSLMVLNSIKKMGYKVQLCFIGSGEAEKLLYSECRKLNLSFTNVNEKFCCDYDVVFCSPMKGLSWIRDYFDFALFPSRYEGLNISILECLTVNMPVISSDCDYGPKEIFDLTCQELDSEFAQRNLILLPKIVDGKDMADLWANTIVNSMNNKRIPGKVLSKQSLDINFKKSWQNIVKEM